MTLRSLLLLALSVTTQFAFGQIKPGWQFRDELMAHLISPKDTIYIQDRHKLEKVPDLKFTDSQVMLDGKLKSEDEVSITISFKNFETSSHKMYLSDTVYKIINNEKKVDYLISKNLINGKKAYGLDGGFPRTEIKDIQIEWNTKALLIPDDSFANFFDVHPETAEAYQTKDKKFLYLYLSASDGAGSYAVKFVFDKKGFVTRLISTNECTDGFDFIDALPQDCQ